MLRLLFLLFLAINNKSSKPKGLMVCGVFTTFGGVPFWKEITQNKYLQRICVTLLCQHRRTSFCLTTRTGWQGRVQRALQLLLHSVAKKKNKTLLPRPPPRLPRWVAGAALLLQHLTPRLWEFEGQKTARRQRPRGEEDGHRLGDAHERGEDAYS